LAYYVYELQKADFHISNANIEYSNWDSLGEIKGIPEYACPYCLETLFTSEEEAIKFLKSVEHE